jgi:hypothetical protein
MNGGFSPIERGSMGVCCVLTLLLFFFPLLALRVPMADEQQVSGYDVFSKVNGLRENLKSTDLPSTDKERLSVPQTDNPRVPSPPSPPDLPLSVEMSWLIPIAIGVAFLSAIVALIGAFLSTNVARLACAIGACSSALAILHITVMNSDLHSWFANSMKAQQADLKDNPFGGFAEGLSNLIANAFQLKPGWGLYAVLILLGMAAALGFSRILSRVQLAPPQSSE